MIEIQVYFALQEMITDYGWNSLTCGTIGIKEELLLIVENFQNRKFRWKNEEKKSPEFLTFPVILFTAYVTARNLRFVP